MDKKLLYSYENKFFVCKHFAYVSVTNRNFFVRASTGRKHEFSSGSLFLHRLSHYIHVIWIALSVLRTGKRKQKTWATHTRRDEQWIFAPLGPVSFTMQKNGFFSLVDGRRRIALLDVKWNCFQWCIISTTCFRTRFNEFRSPKTEQLFFFFTVN